METPETARQKLLNTHLAVLSDSYVVLLQVSYLSRSFFHFRNYPHGNRASFLVIHYKLVYFFVERCYMLHICVCIGMAVIHIEWRSLIMCAVTLEVMTLLPE